MDDSLVCPSYVINTSFLQEKIKRTRDENPELRYHEDNEEYLIRRNKETIYALDPVEEWETCKN